MEDRASVALLLSFSIFLIFFFISGNNRRWHGSAAPLPPGPRGWPVFGNLLQLSNRPHRTLHDMSQTFGDLMHLRMGSSNVVVASSSRAAALILKTHDSNFSSRPVNSISLYFGYNSKDIVWSPYGPRWRMLRNLCSVHLLSPRAIEDTRIARGEEVAALVQNLRRLGAGEEGVQVEELLTECTGNYLSRVIIGKRLFGERSTSKFLEVKKEVTTLMGSFVIGDYVRVLRWLDLGGVVARMKKASKNFDDIFVAMIAEHRRSSAAAAGHVEDTHRKVDMMSKLLELQGNVDDGEGGKLSDVEVRAILMNMFLAGTNMSSGTVEWALSELVRHPEKLKKVQEELDAVVGRRQLVAESDLPNLIYLHAVIKETFRLHPVAPLGGLHLAGESCEVDGYHVPKNSIALINVWAIGRDPEKWGGDPLEFRPERFLPGGEHAGVEIAGKGFELVAFGGGRRTCVGMNLGVLIVQLMLAAMVHAFDWRLPAGRSPEQFSMEEVFGITIRRADPLLLCPDTRLHESAY